MIIRKFVHNNIPAKSFLQYANVKVNSTDLLIKNKVKYYKIKAFTGFTV